MLLIAGRPGPDAPPWPTELARQVADRYPGRGAAGPAHRARRRRPSRSSAPPANCSPPSACGPGRAPPRTTSRRPCATASPSAGCCSCSTTWPTAEQVDALLPDTPAVPGRRHLRGPADRRSRTSGPAPSAASTPRRRSSCWPRTPGQVRITVDPRGRREPGRGVRGQPAALALAGGWLAARPKAAVGRRRRQAAADAAGRGAAPRPLGPGLPAGPRRPCRGPAARMLRLLALAPAGLVDAHIASALAGCSVTAPAPTLDDFVALGLLRAGGPAASAVPGARLPRTRCSRPCWRPRTGRPRCGWPGPGCWSGPCGCCSPAGRSPSRRPRGARASSAGMPRALRFPTARAAADWLTLRLPALLAAARLAVADGELDTLARRLVSPPWCGPWRHRGPRRRRPSCTGCTAWSSTSPSAAELPREKAAALLNLADLDAADRPHRARRWPATGRRWTPAGRRTTRTPTGRAMESAGRHLPGARRTPTGPPTGTAGRSPCGWPGASARTQARLHGRLGAVHTYARPLRRGAARVAGRGGRRTAGSATGRPGAGAERGGPGPGVRRTPGGALRTCREALDWARQAGDVRLEAALQLRLGRHAGPARRSGGGRAAAGAGRAPAGRGLQGPERGPSRAGQADAAGTCR